MQSFFLYVSKSPQPSNLDTPNTWVTIGKTYFGLSHTQTPIARYAIKMNGTHGPIYYPHASTHSLKDSELHDTTKQYISLPKHYKPTKTPDSYTDKRMPL
jgi:hypothetical protein